MNLSTPAEELTVVERWPLYGGFNKSKVYVWIGAQSGRKILAVLGKGSELKLPAIVTALRKYTKYIVIITKISLINQRMVSPFDFLIQVYFILVVQARRL